MAVLKYLVRVFNKQTREVKFYSSPSKGGAESIALRFRRVKVNGRRKYGVSLYKVTKD